MEMLLKLSYENQFNSLCTGARTKNFQYFSVGGQNTFFMHLIPLAFTKLSEINIGFSYAQKHVFYKRLQKSHS